MPNPDLIKLKGKTYLKLIENSVDTRLFNSVFVKDKKTGRVIDVFNNGELSCAFFVSAILTLVSAIDRPHSTVKTTIKKLKETKEWEEISFKSLSPGDVVVWEELKFPDGTKNEHIGFILNKKTAVSTDYRKKKVVSHDPTFGKDKYGNPKRKISKIFRNLELTRIM